VEAVPNINHRRRGTSSRGQRASTPPTRAGVVAVAAGALRGFDIPHTPPSDLTGNPILPWEFPIQAIHSPVGGRLQYFWTNWQMVGSWVLNVLRKGYKLHFSQIIQLSPIPIEFQKTRDPVIADLKHGIIMEYLKKDAIEVAPSPLSPGFYSGKNQENGGRL
jgi:hypothetical protein